MIKKLQKLKAKKGFTLVELIVVIAIIGVLAAILIPTMLGFVTSSRVTSANSTAASIKKQIDNFLTDADTAGYGMKQSASAKANITFKVDDAGKWSAAITTGAYTPGSEFAVDTAFKNGSKWGTDGTASNITKDSPKANAANAVQLLTIDLASVFPDVKSSYIFAYCEGGKTLYVAYTADGTTLDSKDLPSEAAFKAGKFAWDGNTAGITASGITLGTAPALSLGTADAPAATTA